ncbi:hypothetical protein HNO92_000869 [Chromobacterium alkanivorans]|nr:hypothetical protein [Chromobacterium alkanivorans]MCS3817681.1 hypothetical protein [Chromobacterium alkanivorans]MCS3872575.1 hypothetical protein [Chromobacterium alkanivorans]
MQDPQSTANPDQDKDPAADLAPVPASSAFDTQQEVWARLGSQSQQIPTLS